MLTDKLVQHVPLRLPFAVVLYKRDLASALAAGAPKRLEHVTVAIPTPYQ